MRKLLGVLCVLSVVALAGCEAEVGDRQREMSKYNGKTVSEAYLHNNKVAVIRFSDGEMLEIKDGGDKGLEINDQDD